MATQNNTIKTRIQLKNDTEANWIKAVNFIPKKGEVIIYSAETDSDELPAGRTIPHPFSRLKVGDGVTTVNNLPFIDAGTLNGNETEIAKYANFSNFPLAGSPNQLYVDLSTNKIYHYTPTTGYKQLAKFSFTTTKTSIRKIYYWDPGSPTLLRVENNILKVDRGIYPELQWTEQDVITDIQEEENT